MSRFPPIIPEKTKKVGREAAKNRGLKERKRKKKRLKRRKRSVLNYRG